MTAYRDTAAPPVSVTLPVGTLLEASGQIRISMPHNARTRGEVRAILERFDGEAADWLAIPSMVDDRGDELLLEYAEREALSFAAALPQIQRQPAIYLPELVELAFYLAACAQLFDRIQTPVLIAPATVRLAPGREGGWRLLVVPLVDMSLAGWAHAAPEAWSWTPSARLLGSPAPHADAYAVGAALATGLAGDIFPAHVAPGARFVRALRGWVGQPARITTAVRAALPASFSAEATALAALIPSLLSAPPADWRAQLDQLRESLAPLRTAVRWEHEGKLDVARGILERMATRTARDRVPWDTLARLRGSSEDSDGALQAAIDALAADPDEHNVRELAAASRRLAHDLPADRHRPMLERAVAAVDALGPRLGDLGRLHFAHLEARYLDRLTEAAARLARPAAQPWDNIVREIVLARIHAARGEWAHIAKRCKQLRPAIQAMPSAGGQLGAYVTAYLDYLDGVAHCAAAKIYRDAGYLADAFDRLVASIGAALGICGASDPLVDGGVDWLHTVAEQAAALDVPDRATIASGVTAYLGALGLTRRTSELHRRETPAIAWYDAARLLALSGAP